MDDIDVEVVGWLHNATVADLKQLYLDDDMLMCRKVVGDYYVRVDDKRKKIKLYVSDFGGTQSAAFLPRNKTIKVDYDGNLLRQEDTFNTMGFVPYGDYKPPVRRSYDHFFEILSDSIEIRHEEGAYVALSGGADSGSIAATLLKLNKRFNVITSRTNEIHEVLDQRLDELSDVLDTITITKDPSSRKKVYTLWNQCAADLGLTSMSGEALECLSHYHIAKYIRGKVLLSGLGADEFYGVPNELLLRTFMTHASMAYKKFNVDTRFPLLDPNVYSAYQNLEPKLRDGVKIPLFEYLKQNNFPHYQEKKVPFVVGQMLL